MRPSHGGDGQPARLPLTLALAAVVTTAAGCFSPDLGPAPFRCAPDMSCPSGYACVPLDPQTLVCQRVDGGTQPPPDVVVPDTVVIPDAVPPPDVVGGCQPTDFACLSCAAVQILPMPPAGQPSTITHDGVTSGMGGFAGSCPANPGGDAEAPEVVYLLPLPFPARIDANTEGSTFDTLLYVRSSCQIGAGDLSCNDDISSDPVLGRVEQSQISVELQPGEYYIFVDGFNRLESGAYVLNLSVTPL